MEFLEKNRVEVPLYTYCIGCNVRFYILKDVDKY